MAAGTLAQRKTRASVMAARASAGVPGFSRPAGSAFTPVNNAEASISAVQTLTRAMPRG